MAIRPIVFDRRCPILNVTAWTLADIGQPQRSLELHQQTAELAAQDGHAFLRLVAQGSVASRHLDLAEVALAVGERSRANDLLARAVTLHEAALAEAKVAAHHSVALHLLVSYGASFALQQAFAESVCERLRRSIQQSSWKSIHRELTVTASFGLHDVAGYPSLDTGLGRADILLYQAKRDGRNRVCVG